MVETAHAHWKIAIIKRKAALNGETFHVVQESMSLNLFPVTDLRPEVELMHLLRMLRHYYRVWNRRHWTDREFAWTLSRWRNFSLTSEMVWKWTFSFQKDRASRIIRPWCRLLTPLYRSATLDSGGEIIQARCIRTWLAMRMNRLTGLEIGLTAVLLETYIVEYHFDKLRPIAKHF